MSRERSCLILKPVINENEIEFCSFQKSINATNDQLFPAPGKPSEICWHFSRVEVLRWAMGTLSMCVPDIAQHRATNQPATSPQKQFQKFNIQENGKRNST